LAAVAQGQTVEMTLTSFPDYRFIGEIDVVDSYLDPKTHLGIVWATLHNNNKDAPKLFPGMSGRVQIQSKSPIESIRESITIPLAAVIRDGAERFVLVEQERTEASSTYKKQTVALGRRDGELIEVRGGELYPGDRVVVRGSHELGGFFAKGVLRVSPETANDIGLMVAKPAAQTISRTISIDGVIDVPPTQRSIAAVQLGGAIEQILVDRGEKVSRGQLLALIHSQPFQDLQLELLRADVETRLNQSIVNSLRSASDAIAQRQLWEAENKLLQFTSRRDGLIQQLRTVGLDASQIESLLHDKELVLALPVRAPIDGVIVGFDKFLGHVVQPDEPLFEVHDLSQAWVKGFISERDLASVQIGQQVRVRFVASPDEVIAGTVVRSGQAVSELDRTLSIWMELKQMPTFALQHNMLARITIETGSSEPGLAVPHEAIIREGTRAYVFVEQADKSFERRFVTTGTSDDRHVFILSGLSSDEAIATGGAAALQSGYAALK
jgi:membrane fusion protein, heavy metal efflux system